MRLRDHAAPAIGTPRETAALGGSLHLLATRRFGTFWFASLLSSIGTWTQQVAEPWLLLALGASPFLVGLDSFAATAPVWLLSIVGGTLADRGDRRRIIATFQSIQMLCPIAVVGLLMTGRIQPWMIIALSTIVGLTDAVSMPSFQSIVPSIVEHDQIGPALALNSTQFNLSRIVGPSVAGLIMARSGALACFVVSALSYVPFIGVALWILPPRGFMPPRPHPSSILRNVGSILAVRAVRRSLLTVLATTIFCSPLLVFSPVLVREAFHGTAAQFSTAIAMFGVGGLAGAGALLAIGPGVDRSRVASAFAIVYGGVVVLAALNPVWWGLPILLVMAGIAMTMSNTSANTVLQLTADPSDLGQTVSLYLLALSSGNSIGSVLTGAAVSALGVRRALLANGLAAIVAQAVIVRIDRRSPAKEER